MNVRATRAMACAALTAMATAQELRRPVAGRVLDGNGQPVAAATVVLCGALLAPAWNAPPDVVQAQSDERGRFRAEVRECIEYSAFAVAWTGGDRRVSALQHGVVPGPRLDLVVDVEPLAAMTVAGLEPFAARQPFSARLWLDGSSGYSVTTPIANGRIAFPELWPRASCRVEFVGAEGRSFHIASAGVHLTIHAPRTIDVVVEDDTGAPVADAEIYFEQRIHAQLPQFGHSVRYRRLSLGTSDADGRARVTVVSPTPTDETIRSLILRAHKQGFVDAYSGWDHTGSTFADGLPPAEAIGEHGLRLRLAPGLRKQGTVRFGDSAVANCEVLLRTQRFVQVGNGVGYSVDSEHRVTTDAAGRYEIDDIPLASKIEQLMLGPTALAAAPADPARAMAPGQPLVYSPPGDAFDCDLAALGRVAVQVLGHDGGPASAAVLILMPPGRGDAYPDANDPRYRLDRAGRTVLVLQPGEWFVLALDGHSAAWQSLAVTGTSQDLELRLAELPRLRGRVVDAAGKPVADATLRWTGCNFRTRPEQKGPVPEPLRGIQILLYQRWIPTVQSDADGNFAMPMFANDCTNFTVLIEQGDRRSEEWQLRLEEDAIHRVLR